MRSRSTEIRHLQAFSALAHELHFGRAAQQLGMTQPALSQLVREFETKVGFRVVERTTRKVILTAAGRNFLTEAEAILLRLDRAVEMAQAQAGQATNSIRIGAILPTTFGFMPKALAAFRHRYPTAAVQLETRESPQLATAVETGALHVALLRPPANTGSLQLEILRREPFVAAMRTDHRLAGQKRLKLAQLKPERVLRMVHPGLHGSFSEIDRQMEDAGFDLSLSPVAQTTLTALTLVSAGDGISLVPAWVTNLPWEGLCFRTVDDLTARIELAVAWEGSLPNPIVQHFIDVARRTAA